MNTPTKGEGQIEIPEEIHKRVADEAQGRKYHYPYNAAFAEGAFFVYRSLSPSIDRYPRWVKAAQRRPPPNKKIVVRLAFGNVEEKWFGPYELRKDDFTTKIIEWLEEEQPSESPAITDK